MLAAKIREKSNDVNSAASLTLNRTATATVNKSIEEITGSVNLEPSYIKKHLKVTARASPANLRTIITANERGTLLGRYPNFKTKDGMRVAINKGSGYRELRGAFRVTGLKNSDAAGIALRNRDAVAFVEASMRNTKGSAKKSRKLANIKSNAENKPNGIYVLHSRSVNQLFVSVRDDVKPFMDEFMADEFLTQFERKSK
ncbi:neck protein [Vibrio phage 1.083.O._10N.286.52.B9]|nr:neck protein [Vibrio phage 1.083.O._10N.286.52.B9]AUS02260.1 neck protein [Vibrio phage 2.096.O._10N.286.48.B5]